MPKPAVLPCPADRRATLEAIALVPRGGPLADPFDDLAAWLVGAEVVEGLERAGLGIMRRSAAPPAPATSQPRAGRPGGRGARSWTPSSGWRAWRPRAGRRTTRPVRRRRSPRPGGGTRRAARPRTGWCCGCRTRSTGAPPRSARRSGGTTRAASAGRGSKGHGPLGARPGPGPASTAGTCATRRPPDLARLVPKPPPPPLAAATADSRYGVGGAMGARGRTRPPRAAHPRVGDGRPPARPHPAVRGSKANPAGLPQALRRDGAAETHTAVRVEGRRDHAEAPPPPTIHEWKPSTTVAHRRGCLHMTGNRCRT